MVRHYFNSMGSAELFGMGRNKKFKMKIFVSSGFRNHATHSTTGNSALLTAQLRCLAIKYRFIVLQYPDLWIQIYMWQYMYESGYGLIVNAKFC